MQLQDVRKRPLLQRNPSTYLEVGQQEPQRLLVHLGSRRLLVKHDLLVLYFLQMIIRGELAISLFI